MSERWRIHSDDKGPRAEESLPKAVVLGRTLQDFATPVGQLSGPKEMVLSTVHPLAQIYTLPRDGQLAYVGHACNFRQSVTKFFKSLPVLPKGMPFVMVCPKAPRNVASSKMPLKVSIERLRAAFTRPNARSPYYANVNWDESSAQAWSRDTVTFGATWEEDLLDDQALAINHEDFDRLLQEADSQRDARDVGLAMGRWMVCVGT